MLRIGVIGAGSHSKSCHGPALAAVKAARPDEVALAAVCDLDRAKAEAYARQFGFGAAYTDWRAMLDKERLDGLIAVTPIARTCELGCELLRAGVPLVIEKPPGASAGETQELLRVALETGAPHMISFNRRFVPSVARARDWLARHAPKEPPRLVRAEMLREGRAEPDFAVGTGIHAVDTVLSFLGRPERVRARREAADKGWALFEADVFSRGGASARVTIRPQCRWDAELYRLLAPTYAATMDVFECRVVITDTEGPILDWSAPAGAPESFRNGTVGETEAFLRALKGERPFAPTLQDGLAAMQVAEAMQNGVQDVCLP